MLPRRRCKLIFVVVVIFAAVAVVATSLFLDLKWNLAKVINIARAKDSCQPKVKIGFAKTHKTASSTVQNVLLQHGMAHNAEFLLGARQNHLGRLPNHFKPADLAGQTQALPWHAELSSRAGYDVAAFHTRWNHTAMRQMLGEEAVFATILRDPVSQFESMYNYYDFYKGRVSIHKFIKDLADRKPVVTRMREFGPSYGFNQQLWDLGMNHSSFGNATALQSMIETIDRDFDLVMIAERMDESMVLLADLLCVPLTNVTSLKVNVRKPGKVDRLSYDETLALQKFLEPDMRLYYHFRKRMDERISNFGSDRMASDAKKLRRLNTALRSRCVLEEGSPIPAIEYKPYGDNVLKYRVKANDFECRMAAMTELPLVEWVRTTQLARWRKKLGKERERQQPKKKKKAKMKKQSRLWG